MIRPDGMSRARGRLTLPLLLLLVAASAGLTPISAFAQEGGEPEGASPNRLVREFPFDMVSNKPFVQVRVNDSEPLWFILDTGCSGISSIEWDTAVALGLKLSGEKKVHIGAGEGLSVRIASTQGVTIDVHGESFPVPEARVIELDHIERWEGHRFDGLLGEDFLRRYVVEIDYAKKVIRLFDPESFRYQGPGHTIPIGFLSGIPATRVTITPPGADPIDCTMVVDTGARVTIIFNRPFAEKHGLRDSQAKLISGIVGCGAGGVCKGDVGRLASVRWGPFLVQEPVAIFSRDKSGFFSGTGFGGLIGAELLRRCKVTFDYSHHQMILEPAARKPAPYEYDMSGAFVVAEGEGFKEFKIQYVMEDSPADAAGMEEGDRITEVNGRPAREHTLGEIRDLLRKDGTECRLGLMRGDRPFEVKLSLRRRI